MANEVLNLDFNDGILPNFAYRSSDIFTAASGKLQATSDTSSGHEQIMFETGVADGVVNVRVNTGGIASGDATTAVRGKTDGSHIGVSVLPRPDNTVAVAFYSYNGSSYTELIRETTSPKLDITGDVLIEVTLEGDSIIAVFNGGYTLTHTTSFNNDGTLVGLSVTKQAVSLDDIAVSAAPAGVDVNSYNIVWDGDSRTDGQGSTPPLKIPTRVNELLIPTPTFFNFSVRGQQTFEAQSTFDANIIPAYDETKEFNIYVLNGFGINDIQQGRTSSAITASLLDLAQRAKAVGYYVVIATIPPRNDFTEDKELIRTDVNNWIITNTETSIDLRYDLNSDSRIGVWSSTYYADKDHLNYDGQDIWAENIAEAIANEFVGLDVKSSITLSIGAPDGTYKVYLLDQSDNVVYNGNATFSGGSAILPGLPVAAGTSLEGYTIDNESPHANGAVIAGVTA